MIVFFINNLNYNTIREFLVITLILFSFQNSANAQVYIDNKIMLPKPKGIYEVGTKTYFWIDENREEIFTKDKTDKRHLLVQVWYPAQISENDTCSPYILNPDEFGKPTDLIKTMMSVKTNSVLNANLVTDKDVFPIILFSHGMGMTRFSCTFLMEHLASNGYVVFSIGHTFFSGTAIFPDGYKPEQDFYPENEADNLQNKTDQESIHYVLETFKKDTEFILSQIARFNETADNFFYRRLDLCRIGICGWSIGGINAAQMCIGNNSIKSGINFDGLAGGDIIKEGTKKAFMIMKSGLKMPENLLINEKSFLKNSSGDTYRIIISKAIHTNFSDMPLFSSEMKGEINTEICFDIINNISLDFFNKYVLGIKGISIKKTASQYIEVNLEKF